MPRRSTRRWIPQPVGISKNQVDCACARENGKGTFGAVCRDSNGKYLGSSVVRTVGVTDPASLEALACQEGLALALDLFISHVVIASDCQGVINDIHKGTGGIYVSVIKEIKATVGQFQQCSFIFEERDTNFEGHSLAKHAFGLDFGQSCLTAQSPKPQLYSYEHY